MKGFIKRLLREGLLSEEDYRGEHEAPDNTNGFPITDLSECYGDEVYSYDCEKLFGTREGFDNESCSIIRSVKGQPNAKIKVYRAVPDLNYDNTSKIKELNKILSYYYKFKFFPMNNEIIDNLESKYSHIRNYEESNKAIIADINNQIDELGKQKRPNLTIEDGDWVTISKAYAKSHGKSNLDGKYKVISKVVKASELYSECNSIHEWGYSTLK